MAGNATFADVLDRIGCTTRALTFLGGGQDRRITFAGLRDLTAQLSERWAGLGVGHGDRVVLVVADEYEFIPLFLSALRAGVVAVPVYPPYRFGELDSYLAALRRTCSVSGAGCCVVSAQLRESLAGAGLGLAIHTYQDVLAAEPGRVRRPVADDLAFLQFSSGTTGRPKAAAVTHRALLANANAIRDGLATEGDRDRAVSWLPLYHDMGLVGFVLVPMLEQVPTWYLRPSQFARDPMSWPRSMSEIGGTIAFAPNFAYGLVARRADDADLAGLDLSPWRVAGCGAEPVHADTLRAFAGRFAAAGFRDTAFMPSYGLAESTLAVSLALRDHGLRTLRVDAQVLATQGKAVPAGADGSRLTELVSCGVPVTGTEIAVLDASGDPCPDGVEGELAVRGASLADGYFGDLEATARAWRDGWLRTGDLGLCRDGQVYVTGRLKDLIVVNGVNHHPQDIERAASGVEGVRAGNVAALAVRDGDTEGVRLVVGASRKVDPESLAAAVRRAVVREIGLSVLDVFVLHGDLPKTSSGKLRRAQTAVLLDSGQLTGSRR